MIILSLGLFLVIGLFGLILIPLGLPGTFVIVAGAALAGLVSGWKIISLVWVLSFLGLAIGGELLDFVISAVGVKSFGASGQSMTGAFLGSILGAIVGLPLPLIGNVIGAFVGGFLGALVVELMVTENLRRALKGGFGAFLGKVFGSLVKVAIGTMMLVKVIINTF